MYVIRVIATLRNTGSSSLAKFLFQSNQTFTVLVREED